VSFRVLALLEVNVREERDESLPVTPCCRTSKEEIAVVCWEARRGQEGKLCCLGACGSDLVRSKTVHKDKVAPKLVS
jgi:hypothetical protein